MGHSFGIIGLLRTIYPSSTACKRGKARVKSGVVKLFSCSSNDNLIFKGEAFAVGRVLPHLLQLRRYCLDILHARFLRWAKPLSISLPLGTLTDLGRTRSQLIAENALLRQQLIILSRKVKRPACTMADRTLLVLLARLVRTWKQALLIVQPETLLRWHHELFRLVWKHKSKAASHTPKVAPEIVALIREMAMKNRRLRC